MAVHQKTKNAQQKQKQTQRMPVGKTNTAYVGSGIFPARAQNVISRNQKSQNISSLFSFFILSQKNATNGRWALCVSAIVKKKRPAQEVLCWVLFGRWARNVSGYRQV